MAAVFGPKANLITKLVLLGAAAGLLTLFVGGWVFPSIDYYTRVGFVRPQPVPFSHEHHVGGLGLDCRYCHTSVEVSANAGMPPTHTCMTCHSQLWTNAEVLAPVRQSLAEGEPIRWNRVYDLPDYVFFNHSIHVAKGVGCTTCHGQIDRMPLTWQAASLSMGWCLDCHRDPAPNLRPREEVFDTDWKPTPDTPTGEQLLAAYDIHPATLSDCSVCHR
ncbi:cytochrome C [Skermanella mucosa]|uniref:cytochrome c3 family protein n=1 Tax=Skermanella mucosa TaxID=1789672 RepID=UPI00192AEB06|nr:cytochrome c3 family protein [Skermanella mucosa]UEM18554.1 cytochrome C [Skermanella mucosa]